MKKRFSLIAVALILVLMSVAFIPSAFSSSDLPVNLTFIWSHTEKPERVRCAEDAIEKYQALHPNVTIELTKIGFADLVTAIITSISAGAPYDLYTAGAGDVKIWLEKDNIANLTPYFEKDDGAWKNLLSDGIYKSITYTDGNVYIVPQYVDSAPMNYHKEIFEEMGLTPPVTGADLFELSPFSKMRAIFPSSSTVP